MKIAADGIAFATPVYAYQVPAPLKRIIGRWNRIYWRGKINIPLHQ